MPNGDYNVVSTQRVIEKCGNMTCLDVTIIDDNVVEIIESFEVRLMATPGLDHSISVDGSAEITIIDNDSEFQLFELYISLRFSEIFPSHRNFSVSQELLLVSSLQLQPFLSQKAQH